MATFTITAANTNIDSLSGKVGDDTYNINGGQLVIDQDSLYGTNGGYILGPVTGSSTLGGDIIIDGRAVRLIPYDTGSGNVPAYNTTISQGSASGLLIGVYSALNVAPTTPGSAMPASGYIKVKQWNSVAYTSGALTGIGANATGADVAGWIEVIGAETRSITINGLNNVSTPQVRGEWFYIGTTPGTPARSDTYQIPTNGNTCFCPGVFVETAAGSGTYEIWHTTTDTATVDKVPTDDRGKRVCWVSSAGVLRFGHDGTNSTGGALPAAGCKIRIGNVFLNSATAATPGTNTLSSTFANRYDPAGSTLGTWSVDKCMMNWYFSVAACNTVTFTNTVVMGPMILSTLGGVSTFTDSGITAPSSLSTYLLSVSVCKYGGTWTRFSLGGTYPSTGANTGLWRAALSNDIVLDACSIKSTGARPLNSVAVDLNFVNNFECKNSKLAGSIVESTGEAHWFHDNEHWSDNEAVYAKDSTNASLFTCGNIIDSTYEDLSFPISLNIPSGWFYISSSCKDLTFRNWGTRAAPIVGRGYAESNLTISRSGTTATVTTSSPHGLSTNDKIATTLSENAAAVTLGQKTITVTGANTFTFTCVNSGSTSFKISFYHSILSTSPFAFGSSNCENIKIQNIWFTGQSVNDSYHSTMKKIYYENVGRDTSWNSSASLIGSEVYYKGQEVGGFMPGQGSAVLGVTFVQRAVGAISAAADATGVSWTASSSTITVTNTDHGLVSNQLIQTYNSSVPGRAREDVVAVTVLTKDTFTYAGTSTGAASGTLSYRVFDGQLMIPMNGPTSSTASEVVTNAGTPKFTGSSSAAMFTVGDQITWTVPHYMLEFDSIPKAWPFLSVGSGTAIDNYDIEYAIDKNDGNGFSSFKNMYVHRTSGAGTSGAFTITLNDTTGLAVNDYVWATRGSAAGVGPEAKIVSIDSSTQITVDVANTATFSGLTLIFGQHPNESGFTADGIKIKMRVTTITANTGVLNYIVLPFKTTNTSRDRLYPQSVDGYTFTLSGLPTGTTVAMYDSTDTELQREDNITSGEFEYFYVHSGVDIADVYYVVWHEDYVPFKSDPFDLTAANLGLSYTPVDDTVWDAAYDDRYTIDYATKRIIMGTGENTYDVRGAYSKWKADIFNADNFTYDFAFEVLGNVTYNSPKRIPPFTELVNSWKIRPDEANHTLTVENGILYATSGADPFVDTLGAYTVRVMYSQPVEVLGFDSGSGVTPGDITDIVDAVWDEALSGHTTAGTAGKTLSAAKKKANIAANK